MLYVRSLVRQNNIVCEPERLVLEHQGCAFFESVESIGCGERVTGTVSNGLRSRITFDLEGELCTIPSIHVYGTLNKGQ